MSMLLRRFISAGPDIINLFSGTMYNGQVGSEGNYSSNNQRITNTPNSSPSDFWLDAGTYTLTYRKLNSSARDLLECSVLTKNSENVIIDNFATTWHDVPYTFTLTAGGYCTFTMRYAASGILDPADYEIIVSATTV